jgi:hypothetical protein
MPHVARCWQTWDPSPKCLLFAEFAGVMRLESWQGPTSRKEREKMGHPEGSNFSSSKSGGRRVPPAKSLGEVLLHAVVKTCDLFGRFKDLGYIDLDFLQGLSRPGYEP